jgi:5-deoxy-glucuronate isomerase
MSLLVRGEDGRVSIMDHDGPALEYVDFDAFPVAVGESHAYTLEAVEACIVVLGGQVDVRGNRGEWSAVGERESPFDGLPSAVYQPPGATFMITGASDGAEVAVCTAGAKEGVEPRLIGPADIRVETRGSGAMERTIHNILMEDAPAESLLVTEVLTPDGHWSSYPPHKHDRDAPPDETFLEETYYHRIRPDHGFGLQRVYTADGSLDESVAFRDGDVVLVPRGYHTVSAPPGYELYYLNVMAGPRREWRMQNDPEHEWLLNSRTSTTS